MRLETIAAISEELIRARSKYPDGSFPARRSGLTQEIGETLQALEKMLMGRNPATEKHLQMEVTQLAGQCVRFLEEVL